MPVRGHKRHGAAALINLVAFAFAPEGRDVDAEGFGVLKCWRLGEDALDVIAFDFVKAGVGPAFGSAVLVASDESWERASGKSSSFRAAHGGRQVSSMSAE
jgi:hypothetical protein